jgi:hypothetical protein
MFERLYDEEYNVYATKDTHSEEFAVFKKEIEKGRRWLILKSKFRLGIFAVLPSRTINNTWIERDLPSGMFWQWIIMLDECNSGVRDLIARIQPLLETAMRNEEPPRDILMLEMTQELTGQSPSVLFEEMNSQRPPSTQSRVREVADSDEESDSLFANG